MICGACKAEVSITRFCSNCGANLAQQSSTTTATDISYEWVAAVMQKAGYQADPADSEKSGTMLARSESNPNWVIQLRKQIRFLCATSPWHIRAPGMLEKAEFYKAINDANAALIAVQCSVSERDPETVNIQVSMYLCDAITEMDVLAFLETGSMLVNRVLKEAGLAKFLK